MSFLIKFLAIIFGIYIAVMFLAILGIWNYSLYKENKSGGFGRSTNHLAAFSIHVDSYSKTLFGYKIKGELKGEKPLRSNVVYYHNEYCSKAVIVYGVGKNYIKIYGLPSKVISTHGYVNNIRDVEKSTSADNENIHHPLVFKAKIKFLIFGIFFILEGLLFVFFLFYGEGIPFPQNIFVAGLSIFAFSSSYLFISTYFKNRGVLNENGILKIHNKKYHIEDLRYEISNSNQQYILKIQDENHKQIAALFEGEKGFNEFYYIVRVINEKRKKQELYQKIYQTTFYIPLSEKNYYIYNDKGFIDLIAYESLNELEKRIPQAVGDEMTNIEDMVKMTEDFTVIHQIVLLFEDGSSYGVTKNNWKEICDAKSLM